MSGKKESLKVGDKVRITDKNHEYFGGAGAIRELKYANFTEQQKAASGDPELARFAKVGSILMRTRGGRHALVSLRPSQVEKIDVLGVNSSHV